MEDSDAKKRIYAQNYYIARSVLKVLIYMGNSREATF